MQAQVMQLGLAGQPGCLPGGVERSQGAGAEVVEMALLRRKLDFCASLHAPSSSTVTFCWSPVVLLGSTIARSQLNAFEGGSRTLSGSMCKGGGDGIVMGWDGIISHRDILWVF